MDNQKHQIMTAMLCMTRQCWEQGIAAQALLEAKEEKALSLVVHDMVLRQSSDGRLCNVENTPAVTDSAFCIPAVWMTGIRENNSLYIKAAEENLAFLLKEAERGADGTLYHMLHTKEIWADSAAFLPYSLALTGHYKEAFLQMEGICSRLYSEEKGLYLHMWNDADNSYLRPLAWGVGNGWILTGLLRMISVWDHAYRTEERQLKKRFCELISRMLGLKTKNHGFHDILDDPVAFEESETAAMVAYAIYRGVKEKLLEPSLLSRADAIRAALYQKTAPNGLVLDAASSPFFDRPGTSVECQAHMIMMECAYENV